jgi:hypothetical protein
MSDMAGYAERVAVERSGSCRDTMEPRGASDIDGQTERSIWAGAHESKSGQRTSFKPRLCYFAASDFRRRKISARLRSEVFTASAFGNTFATSGSKTTTLLPRA